MRGIFWHCLLAAALQFYALGQTLNCGPRHIVVTPLGPNYVAVGGLSKESFAVNVDNQSAEVADVQPLGNKRLILLFDNSGSMHFHARVEAALAADFVRALPPTVQVALVTFNDTARVRNGLTASRESVLESLDSIPEGSGRTAIASALASAAQLLSPPETGDAIVIVTDGTDDARDRDSMESVIKQLASSGIRVIALTLFEVSTLQMEGLFEGYNHLTLDTGGVMFGVNTESFPAITPNDVHQLAWKMVQVLSSSYDAEILSAGKPQQYNKVKLRIVRAGKAPAALTYSRWLPPCSAAQPSK